MNKNNIIRDKSRAFAIRIVRLYQYIVKTKREHILSKQLLKSGTSIGANVSEAICGISEKNFLSKMYIAYKECNETLYWLDLLHETGYLNDTEYDSILSDGKEIKKLLSSITKTTAEKVELEKR